MDSESCKQDTEGEHTDPEPDAGYVFQPAWLRRVVQAGNGLDRFLLDYGCNFLLRFSFILYLILFIKETL